MPLLPLLLVPLTLLLCGCCDDWHGCRATNGVAVAWQQPPITEHFCSIDWQHLEKMNGCNMGNRVTNSWQFYSGWRMVTLQMLTGCQNSFTISCGSKYLIKHHFERYCHTLNVALPYLVKYMTSFWLKSNQYLVFLFDIVVLEVEFHT